jgi:transcriptional regulator with XRE-family HTH domain
MERPGEKLKQVRERLNLTYRDVSQASQVLSARRGSEEFAIALSRLADIENKGTVPTMFRMYTLCVIYRLDFREVLNWYGVPLDDLRADAMQIGLLETHAIHFPIGPVTVPESLAEEVDVNRTVFLSPLIRRWKKLAPNMFGDLDRRHRYGFIGLEDWSMYPVLHPGSLVLIDQNKRKIVRSGWNSQYDRPIYFLEHRGGYLCGWCACEDDRTLVLPHPASNSQPAIFQSARIDVVGQVTGVAMLLEHPKRALTRSASTPAKSPNP